MSDKQELKPLLEVRQNHLTFVLSYAESLDNKNLAILAANVAALLFALQTLPDTSAIVYFGMFGSYIVSTLINIVGVFPMNYIGSSVDIDKHPEYLSMAEDKLVLQLLSDTQVAVLQNRRLNARRFRLLTVATVLTGLGTLLLMWSIL